MTVADVLRDARARYAAAPSHAPSGEDIEPGCVCLITAINAAAYRSGLWCSTEDAVIDAVGTTNLVDWNAEHSTAEVLAAFDRAIAQAQA